MSEDAAAETTEAPVSEAPVTDAPVSEAPAEAPAPTMDWADMRTSIAGGDESLGKMLSRYGSAEAMGKAFAAQRQKLSERQEPTIPTLGDDPTPEQVAEYRTAMGIPENVDDYAVNFAEGFEVGEADGAALESFKAFMHERNIPPSQAGAAVEWYAGLVETQRQEANANADRVSEESHNALKTEWGRDRDGNINAIRAYLDDNLGAQKAESLRSMRMEDGSMLMDNADVLRLLVTPARDYIGGDGLISGDLQTAAKSVSEEITGLMQLRLNDPAKYKSDEVQSRLSQLYEKKDRITR